MANYPEIRDLQLLIALSQRKHFTQAANDCGISQPAFSARIRHLEDELGIPIVRRGNRFLGFTQEGERVLTWASRILADAEGMRQDIEIAKGTLRGVLVLGVVPTALTYAAEVATRLRERYPNVAIEIHSLTASQIAQGIQDFSLDAGISYEDGAEGSTLTFRPIYKESYVLLVPKELVASSTDKVTWAEASTLPLCLLSKDMHFRQIVDRVFSRAKVSPEPVMETNAFTAALTQVANGSAATIAPSTLVDSFLLHSNTLCLPLVRPTVHHMIGLVKIDHDPALPAIKALEKILD